MSDRLEYTPFALEVIEALSTGIIPPSWKYDFSVMTKITPLPKLNLKLGVDKL